MERMEQAFSSFLFLQLRCAVVFFISLDEDVDGGMTITGRDRDLLIWCSADWWMDGLVGWRREGFQSVVRLQRQASLFGWLEVDGLGCIRARLMDHSNSTEKLVV